MAGRGDRKILRPGDRFGRLVVVRRGQRSEEGYCWWVCRCDCGKEREYRGTRLRNGGARSCGCLRVATRALRRQPEPTNAGPG